MLDPDELDFDDVESFIQKMRDGKGTFIKVSVPTNIFVRLFTWKPVEAMALRIFEEPPCGHELCPPVGWQPITRGWTVNGTRYKAGKIVALELKTQEQIRRSEALGG